MTRKTEGFRAARAARLAAFLCAVSVVAQSPAPGSPSSAAPLPDAKAAEADLRAIVTSVQQGNVAYRRLTDDYAASVRMVIPHQAPIIRSLGPPGAVRLVSQEGRTFTFGVDHRIGEVKWSITYDAGSDRVADLGWDHLVDPAKEAALARWRGLVHLPGHAWRSWSMELGKPDAELYTDICWWTEVAVTLECDRMFPNGTSRRLTYRPHGNTIAVEGVNATPDPLTWFDDGTSHSLIEDPRGDGVGHTFYAHDHMTTQVYSPWFKGRILTLRETYPGQADEWIGDLSRAYHAAVAKEKQEKHDRMVAEVRAEVAAEQAIKDAEYEAEMRVESSSEPDIMGAFMRGMSQGMADNAKLEAILNRGNDVYDNAAAYGSGYEDGYDDGYGGQSAANRGASAGPDSPPPAGQSDAPGTPVTVLLWKGFQVPITPGATSNEGCYARVVVGPVTTDSFKRSHEARRAAASAEQQFLAACRVLGALGSGDFADEWYIDDKAESVYAKMRANRWMHEVSPR